MRVLLDTSYIFDFMDKNRWEERGARPGVRAVATQRIVRLKLEAVFAVPEHHRQGASRCDGGAKKNGPQSIWKIPMRLDHQASYGCRGCPDGRDLLVSPGQAHDAPEGASCCAVSVTSAPDRRVDRATRHANWQPRLHTRRSATQDPAETLGVRPIYKRRNEIETSVPTAEGLPAHLLTLRQTRCAVPGLRPVRTHLRCTSVNRP